MKRIFILSGLLITFFAATIGAMAHSTIYVDDIGRLHFLGKDPGSKAKYVQEVGNFDNPEQKDLTNIIYKNQNETTNPEKSVNTNQSQTQTTNSANKVNKSKSSYSYTKGAMDASNPYTYGNTNIERGVNDTKSIYTDEIGRQHFLGKDSVTKY